MSKQLLFDVCNGKSCSKRGSSELAATLARRFNEEGLAANVTRHPCFDMCERACNVQVLFAGETPRLYTGLHPRQGEAFATAMSDEARAGDVV